MKFDQKSQQVERSSAARLAALLVIPLFFHACKSPPPPQSAAPEVDVVQVEQKDVPIWKDWIGTLDGLVNAQIKPQVTGYLVRQTYKDGAFVKRDQLLFEIDPRTFQAAVDQAKGQLASAEGQLAQAEANQIKAQNDVNRYT
ncbi:MAG TPA: biotin/lipoyl-binding protein, partial [Bryobacteraceae bacterium]